MSGSVIGALDERCKSGELERNETKGGRVVVVGGGGGEAWQ